MLRGVLDLPGRAGWAQRYRELVAYREENGHCCVPKAEGKLGRWVARQREQKKKRLLSADREAKLNALGFVWNTNDNAWENRFRQLTDWRERNGHACVPIAEGDLGLWVAKQRQNKRRQKLPEHREILLNSIGFVWDTPTTDWNEKYQALVRWKNRYGHCRVPFNEGDLGWWVNTQRQSKRKGKLSPEREERLDAIGFIWNPQGVQPPSTTTVTVPRQEDDAVRRLSSSSAGSKRKSSDRLDFQEGSSKRHHSFSSSDSGQLGSYEFLPPVSNQVGPYSALMASSSSQQPSFHPGTFSASSSQSSALSFDREESYTPRESVAPYSSDSFSARPEPARSESQSPMSSANFNSSRRIPFYPPIGPSATLISELPKTSGTPHSLRATAYSMEVPQAHHVVHRNTSIPFVFGGSDRSEQAPRPQTATSPFAPEGNSMHLDRRQNFRESLDHEKGGSSSQIPALHKLPPLRNIESLSYPPSFANVDNQGIRHHNSRQHFAHNSQVSIGPSDARNGPPQEINRPGNTTSSLLETTRLEPISDDIAKAMSCIRDRAPSADIGKSVNVSRTKVSALCCPEPSSPGTTDHVPNNSGARDSNGSSVVGFRSANSSTLSRGTRVPQRPFEFPRNR